MQLLMSVRKPFYQILNKTLFYQKNVPRCIFLGHKNKLVVTGVTILLSLTVFLNLVAETLPQVSDAIPLLGTIKYPIPPK